jgi:hypothetical protein
LYKNKIGEIFIKLIEVYPIATGVRIVTTKGQYEVSKGMRFVLQAMCLASGSSYDGRIQAAKKVLSKERLVPLFIDSQNVLIFTHSIRCFECCAINIFTLEQAQNLSFLSSKKAERAIKKALKVHQIFTNDYDIMKYLKRNPTNEEKNLR